MKIFLTTSGRATVEQQYTLTAFSKTVCALITPVVQASQAADYAPIFKHFGTARPLVLPESVTKLSPTRQWLLDKFPRVEKVVLLDDDLRFSYRSDQAKFHLCDLGGGADLILDHLSLYLDEVCHAGFLAREGANNAPMEPRLLRNTRVLRVLGYNFKVLSKHGVRFDRLQARSDFDVTLQLLRLGFDNFVDGHILQDQRGGGSNATGGCSVYRDNDLLASTAEGLHELHPHFVKCVTKETKHWWGGGARPEVRIAWKKAREEGRIRYGR